MTAAVATYQDDDELLTVEYQSDMLDDSYAPRKSSPYNKRDSLASDLGASFYFDRESFLGRKSAFLRESFFGRRSSAGRLFSFAFLSDRSLFQVDDDGGRRESLAYSVDGDSDDTQATTLMENIYEEDEEQEEKKSSETNDRCCFELPVVTLFSKFFKQFNQAASQRYCSICGKPVAVDLDDAPAPLARDSRYCSCSGRRKSPNMSK